jgi:hypothetical protein
MHRISIGGNPTAYEASHLWNIAHENYVASLSSRALNLLLAALTTLVRLHVHLACILVDCHQQMSHE